MLLDGSQSAALNGLCSGDRIDLMDTIDSLRSQGINHLVSLPQIIVCGDQSSGKSSVLEAISGVPFPVKGNLCTRFPTELVLRRSPDVGATISIIPDHSRSASEKAGLAGFHEELKDLVGFPDLLEDAKSSMGISTHGKSFSKDILRVEISGPDRPHLTIVDLPGLIHSQTKNQSASDIELVQDVVQSYMKQPRSIILAVVSAKNDFANQIVLKLARAADPQGDRTMGVITKPDTLHAGSTSETLYVSLAQNQEVEFRLGWHVLRNMDSDSEKGKGTLTQRDALENGFFRVGVWAELPSTILGIEQLRRRLSKVLLSHIGSELPSLVKEIETKRSASYESLEKLGQPRITLSEQQLYLLGVSESFQKLVTSAVNANCNDRFFQNVDTDHGYQQRIRAVVQNLNTTFANDLLEKGRLHIINDGLAETPSSKDAAQISRSDYVDRIEAKMRRSKGRELPGLFDPMIVADLFREEAGPWEQLTRVHVRRVWRACKTFLKTVVEHVADTETCNALMQKIVDPQMANVMAVLEAKTGEILKSHQTIHPITYDNCFAEAARMIREDRKKAECASAVKKYFGVSTLDPRNVHVDLSKLVDAIVEGITELNTNRQTASEALDYMESYYKVALNRFIDDVAVEAIEVCLVSSLANVLSPTGVYKMSPDLVAMIAGESEDIQARRDQLVRQLDVLSKGAEICKGYVGTNFSDGGSSSFSDFESHPDASEYDTDPGQVPTPEPLSEAKPAFFSTWDQIRKESKTYKRGW
ncbi:dynamin family protein [Grosmannia clavigera kw1407]|uniref:Dynamin family protein n=1 Tax=Grosmannia clavigera (strain kw1407 / UAMH 11150) TaxID=655863 RepID=F0XBF5_GROCL|nr:dynamin family protein [Grosmannia clavigera kw1407]EFX05112.1 dynamin family protein [Grosmannia clavigera kw1407]